MESKCGLIFHPNENYQPDEEEKVKCQLYVKTSNLFEINNIETFKKINTEFEKFWTN
jgi:hypothetical protein